MTKRSIGWMVAFSLLVLVTGWTVDRMARRRDVQALEPLSFAELPSPDRDEVELESIAQESGRPAEEPVTQREPSTPDPRHERQRSVDAWLAGLFPEEAPWGDGDPHEVEVLDLHGKDVQDADLALLRELPNLRSVNLRGTQVTDAGLVHLQAVAHLRELDLRSTVVSGAGLSSVPWQLEALHLTSTEVRGSDLWSLPAMPDLQRLKLNFLELDDQALDTVANFPSLRHLEIDQTAISDQGLRGLLQRNPHLTRIELRRTPVTAECLAELRQQYPDCEFMAESPELSLR